MAKISNVMATKVALDLVDASKSVRNLTAEVNASTKAWQAQEASLRSAGDYAGAAKARLDGLGSAIDAQKEKISALQEKQESMNNISQETAEKFLKLKSASMSLRLSKPVLTMLPVGTRTSTSRLALRSVDWKVSRASST
jgi:phage-related tail protein